LRRINWDNRAPGDIGLLQGTNLLSRLIRDFEYDIHPFAPRDFEPSHSFIFAYNGKVLEATMSLHVDSLCAVNDETEYAPLFGRKVEIWRIARTPDEAEAAINLMLGLYGNEGYGCLSLFGFALEAIQRHAGNPKATNGVLAGYVCSMVCGLFLQYPSSELWPAAIDIRQFDPLQERMLFLANED